MFEFLTDTSLLMHLRAAINSLPRLQQWPNEVENYEAKWHTIDPLSHRSQKAPVKTQIGSFNDTIELNE